MSTTRLTDRVAIVTGGGSGIGEATARRLAAEGARVVIADIRPEEASRVADEIGRAGGWALAQRVDIADPDSVDRLVEATLGAYGAIHVVDNNATAGSMGRVGESSLADWNRTLAVKWSEPTRCAVSDAPKKWPHSWPSSSRTTPPS